MAKLCGESTKSFIRVVFGVIISVLLDKMENGFILTVFATDRKYNQKQLPNDVWNIWDLILVV